MTITSANVDKFFKKSASDSQDVCTHLRYTAFQRASSFLLTQENEPIVIILGLQNLEEI